MQALEKAGGEIRRSAPTWPIASSWLDGLDEARRRFGVIHGVVHAAGIPGGGIIQLKTRAAAAQVLAPKLQGTLQLWDLLEGDRLDFFMLCASITGVVGGPGQVDYCGAECVPRRFCSEPGGGRCSERALSRWIGTPGRRWAWPPGGGSGRIAARRARELAEAIFPLKVLSSSSGCLGSPLPEAIVSTRDLPHLIELARRTVADAKQERTETPPWVTNRCSRGAAGCRPPSSPRALTSSESSQRSGKSRPAIEPIGLEDDFFERRHSPLATQAMSRLYQRLGVDVPLRTLFEARTIAAFAERVNDLTPAGGDREEIEL